MRLECKVQKTIPYPRQANHHLQGPQSCYQSSILAVQKIDHEN